MSGREGATVFTSLSILTGSTSGGQRCPHAAQAGTAEPPLSAISRLPPSAKLFSLLFFPVINQLSKLVDRFLNSIVRRGRVRAIYQNSNYHLSKTFFFKFQFGLVCSTFLLLKQTAPILSHIYIYMLVCIYIHIHIHVFFFPAHIARFWNWSW